MVPVGSLGSLMTSSFEVQLCAQPAASEISSAVHPGATAWKTMDATVLPMSRPAGGETTVSEELRAIVAGRLGREAAAASRRVAARACPECGAAGAVRGPFCDVCDQKVDDVAADLPPAATPAA